MLVDSSPAAIPMAMLLWIQLPISPIALFPIAILLEALPEVPNALWPMARLLTPLTFPAWNPMVVE